MVAHFWQIHKSLPIPYEYIKNVQMDVILTFKQRNIHNIVVNILTSILTFFETYITTKAHNMLIIMLDPWFKNLKIMSDFVGDSIVFQVIAKYNN
jgi:hypothetical protein